MNTISNTDGRLFSALVSKFASYQGLAATALSRAIDLYQRSDYEGSIKEFKRVIVLNPHSENSLKAYDFMAQAYLKLNRTEDAEKTYKEALRSFPTSDLFYIRLGNLYYNEGEKDLAKENYLKAVKINPSSENLYPLGQLYLSEGNYDEAEDTFLQILRIEPKNYGALYSLGQVYSRQGLYNEAIKRFEEVINLKRDFAYVYYDLGALYADTGMFDMAEEQTVILDNLDRGLSEDLRAYIYKVRRPEMVFVNTFYAFDMTMGPGTLISSLDSALTEPNSSKDFLIKAYFDKAMDRTSVENIFNWSISRSTGQKEGGPYNWGLPIPSTEVALPPVPKQVIYNSDEFNATIIFTLRQNNTGDGTIDPSHLVFRFSGKDAYGNRMNPSADEYVGLSIIV